MNFAFDIRTLLILLIFGNVFIVMLITAYRIGYPKDTATTLFEASKWLQSASWVVLLQFDHAPRWIFLPLSNALMLTGGCLEVMALLMMMGMLGPRVKFYYLLLAGGSTISYGVIYLFYNYANLRIASASLWALLFIVYPAYHLTSNKEGSPLQKIMGVMYYVIALLMLVRGVTALTAGHAMNVFTPGTVQYAYYIGMYMFMILGTAGFILLSKEQSYEELKRLATYDELTGILNRRSFILRAQLKIAAAAKNIELVSLLVLDIDHFKNVNDTYGHDIGDIVLADFAATIGRNLGSDDLFGRFGGEEFAILLTGIDEVTCDRKAEELRKAVMETTFCDIPLSYTVSIGVITVVPNQRTPLDMLYKISDDALYRAKREGRNRVVRGRWL
ncbi:GGDEF domain-containing protein [Paenibacillus sp. BR2-3]|uniref:GGDEF domain-containing protein n=1 Tax=Paenibacillus sp. BR2-3 TaxID=3048494 RepID=UPI0039779A5C